jgi:mRNA interferase RelE/StbE
MNLIYHPKVSTDDIPRLNHSSLSIIQRAIEQRLIVDPIKYGLPLRWGLKGYRKMRVGDYRVIYRVVGAEIRIVIIGHRRDVYSKVHSRI